MAKVVCAKCGVTGISKNPATRTVFQDDHGEALLSHLLKFPEFEDVTEFNEKTAVGTIRMYNCSSVKEYFERLIGIVELLKEVGVEQYSCDHEWVLAEGEEVEC